jgi:hypothetical protein
LDRAVEERSGNAPRLLSVYPPIAGDERMGRFVGIHPVPGFTPDMLERTIVRLGRLFDARFVRAYSSFGAGKVVCDWEADDKESVARTYAALRCEQGDRGVDTLYLGA